jgi:hypothetical protein
LVKINLIYVVPIKFSFLGYIQGETTASSLEYVETSEKNVANFLLAFRRQLLQAGRNSEATVYVYNLQKITYSSCLSEAVHKQCTYSLF